MPTAAFARCFLERAWPCRTFKCFSVQFWGLLSQAQRVGTRKVLAVSSVTENHWRQPKVPERRDDAMEQPSREA